MCDNVSILERKIRKEKMKYQKSFANVSVMIIAAGLAVFMMKAAPLVSSMPVA